jgi:hypothetical protein
MGKQVEGLRCVVPWCMGKQWRACIVWNGQAVVGLCICGQAGEGLHGVVPWCMGKQWWACNVWYGRTVVRLGMGKQVEGLHCVVSCSELTLCASGAWCRIRQAVMGSQWVVCAV